MKKKKLSKAQYEKSAMDKKMDKKHGFKEGSKEDEAMDKKMMKKGRSKKRGANPFSSLGKDDKQSGSKLWVGPTQGKRLTGKTLLSKAMGKVAKERKR